MASRSETPAAPTIDTHAHTLPADYVQALVDFASQHPSLGPALNMVQQRVPEFYPPECGYHLFGTGEYRVTALDASGIDRQVLSAGSFTCYALGTPDEVRIELVRRWNNATLSLVRESPDRLSMFAALPLPCVSAAIEEVERLVQLHEVVGFGLPTHVNGRPLDENDWAPLYEVLDRHNATVFVHPDRFCVTGIMPRHLETDIGTQFDDTLATVRLYESVVKSHPGITWIISHLGGAFPFLLGRLEEHWMRDRRWRTHETAPSESFGSLRFDTAGHSAESVEFAIRVLGPDKVLLGTDFPMVSPEDLGAVISSVRSAIPDVMARSKILGLNAKKLLGI